MGAQSEDDYSIELTEWGMRVKNRDGFLHENDANFRRMEHVMSVCHEKGINKLLVDERNTTYAISRYSAYEAADKLLSLGAMGLHIAVVISPEYMEDANVQFLQTAANNRVINLKFFTEEQDANIWLGIHHTADHQGRVM